MATMGRPVRDPESLRVFCPVCESEVGKGKSGDWRLREHVRDVHGRRLGVRVEDMREGRPEMEVSRDEW